MLSRPVVSLLVSVVLVSPTLAGQNAGKYVEKPVEPQYRTMTAKELQSSVTVRGSRSYAVFGYNAPKIIVELPPIDNSVYSEVKFDDPVLVDDAGNVVEYERENGIYDHDSHSDEIRMKTADGDPVPYASAKGKLRVRYPIAIRTHRVAANDARGLGALGVEIEGRSVKFTVDDSVPEPAPFAPFEAIRAFDASGKMIAREQSTTNGMSNGVSWRKLTYRADIRTIEVDRVEKWAGLAVEYDLPRSPMRKKELAGTVDDPDPLIAATPKGDVSIKIVHLIPSSVLGDAADLSRDEIKDQLADLGYRTIDDDSMVRAVMDGKLDAIRLLLAAGVSPDAKRRDDSALQMAASFATPEVIGLLIRAGANVNVRDSVDSTPLISLANRCSTADVTATARTLIDAGADVNAKAKGGGTALMMADVLKCSDLARMLRAAGAREWH